MQCRVRHDVGVKTRIWAIAAAVWAAFYVILYIVVASGQAQGVAWWYVIMVALAGFWTLPAAVSSGSRRGYLLLLGALVLFVLAALLLVFKGFGLLLLPAIVATARALKATVYAAPTD
jgi:hypothetical protein